MNEIKYIVVDPNNPTALLEVPTDYVVDDSVQVEVLAEPVIEDTIETVIEDTQEVTS